MSHRNEIVVLKKMLASSKFSSGTFLSIFFFSLNLFKSKKQSPILYQYELSGQVLEECQVPRGHSQ